MEVQGAPRRGTLEPLLVAAHIGPCVAVTLVVALLTVAADLPVGHGGHRERRRLHRAADHRLGQRPARRRAGPRGGPGRQAAGQRAARPPPRPALPRRRRGRVRGAVVPRRLAQRADPPAARGGVRATSTTCASRRPPCRGCPYAVAFGTLPAVVSLASDPPRRSAGVDGRHRGRRSASRPTSSTRCPTSTTTRPPASGGCRTGSARTASRVHRRPRCSSPPRSSPCSVRPALRPPAAWIALVVVVGLAGGRRCSAAAGRRSRPRSRSPWSTSCCSTVVASMTDVGPGGRRRRAGRGRHRHRRPAAPTPRCGWPCWTAPTSRATRPAATAIAPHVLDLLGRGRGRRAWSTTGSRSPGCG